MKVHGVEKRGQVYGWGSISSEDMLYVWIWGESERDIEGWGTSNEILGHFPLPLLSDFPPIFGVIPLLWISSHFLVFMWLVASKMTPVIPTSWYSYPCGISFPSLWAQPNNLLLTNRIGQKWWDVISEVSLQKDNGFWLSFTCSKKAHCHIVPRNCCGEPFYSHVSVKFVFLQWSLEIRLECWPTSVRDLELEAPSYVLLVPLSHINWDN